MDNTLSSLTPSLQAFQPSAGSLNKMSAQESEKPAGEAAGDTFEKSEPAAGEKKARKEPSSGMKEYTILAYMDGSNNLEDCILEDLKEMENCPPAENYNLVAQFSRFNTKPFTVMFIAEALTHAFKSPDFKAVLKEIVGDSDLIRNYGEILKDPETCQTISHILLSQNPELNDRLDRVVSERVKDSIGKNRTLDRVLSETAVEVLKGVCVRQSRQKGRLSRKVPKNQPVLPLVGRGPSPSLSLHRLHRFLKFSEKKRKKCPWVRHLPMPPQGLSKAQKEKGL